MMFEYLQNDRDSVMVLPSILARVYSVITHRADALTSYMKQRFITLVNLTQYMKHVVKCIELNIHILTFGMQMSLFKSFNTSSNKTVAIAVSKGRINT